MTNNNDMDICEKIDVAIEIIGVDKFVAEFKSFFSTDNLENFFENGLCADFDEIDERFKDPTDDLPQELIVELSEFGNDEYVQECIDDDSFDDLIGDYLSNEYGFCHNGFQYEITDDSKVHIWDIDWDTTE